MNYFLKTILNTGISILDMNSYKLFSAFCHGIIQNVQFFHQVMLGTRSFFSFLMLDKNTKRWFCLKNFWTLLHFCCFRKCRSVVLNFDEIKYWKLFILTAFDRKTEAACHRFPCIFSIHFSTQGNSGRSAIKYCC